MHTLTYMREKNRFKSEQYIYIYIYIRTNAHVQALGHFTKESTYKKVPAIDEH
jgi:hypothetical protein